MEPTSNVPRSRLKLHLSKCAVKPRPLGWGYKARLPNLRKQLKADNFFLLNYCIN